MITRKRYSQEFKRNIALEVASGITSAGEISKREGISATAIYKWRDKIAGSSRLNSDESEILEYKRKLKEMEEIISDQAIQIHILKKTQKIMDELKKQERLSGSISPRSSESK